MRPLPQRERVCQGDVHTKGIEVLWSHFKRGNRGTFHQISDSRLDRYVSEFEDQDNVRDTDTTYQMAFIDCGMVRKRIKHDDLVGKAEAAA